MAEKQFFEKTVICKEKIFKKCFSMITITTKPLDWVIWKFQKMTGKIKLKFQQDFNIY